MTEAEARAHYNFLMTLCIRREEAFGPLAMAFTRGNDLDALGLTAEEQLNLYMATAEAFSDEPRRHPHRLHYLRLARQAVDRTARAAPGLAHELDQAIAKAAAELEIFNQALRHPAAPRDNRPSVIVESDLPDYFLSVAQKRAADYYRTKYAVSEEARIGLNFKGPTRRFEPDNTAVHKDIAGACAPFMDARTSAFHLMFPFDLKMSRAPEKPLDAGMRIWYVAPTYSFPLSYEQGRFCSWYDGGVVELAKDDPHLVYVSVSALKEAEMGLVQRPLPPGLPMELAVPVSFLNAADGLGPYIQFGCNFKVWFNPGEVSLLTQGAPDLAEYGLVGGQGLITRTYGTEKVDAYAHASDEAWQESLSFNYVNIHLQLLPNVQSAFVPFNTPLFSVYFLQPGRHVDIRDARDDRRG